MKNVKNILFGFLISIVTLSAWGQNDSKDSPILEKSTGVLYGAQTTRRILEKDIFFKRWDRYQPVDTTLLNYHHWTYTQQLHNRYKDLGNIGTALHSIFPKVSSIMGVSTGFNAYEPYFSMRKPYYVDTRSPYTLLRVVLGGGQRSTTDIEFSRNINPRWNFGFDFKPILIDKQIQRSGRGDRQTTSYYYDIYMAYRSKNNRYGLMFSYRKINHTVQENGGVKEAIDYASLFDVKAQPNLTAAVSEESRSVVHLFQEYGIKSFLDVYHQFDMGDQDNFYRDNLAVEPVDFYDHKTGTENNDIDDQTRFFFLVNKVGVKGRLSKLFYDAHFKIRSYEFRYNHITDQDTLDLPLQDLEYSYGTHVEYTFDSLTHLEGWVDFLVGDYYTLGGTWSSKWIDAKVMHTVAKPSFIHSAYRGAFDFWNNQFSETTSTQMEVLGTVEKGSIVLSAGLTFTAYQRYIYFRKGDFTDLEQTVLPIQSSGLQELWSPEVRIVFKFFRHFYLRPHVIYSVFTRNDDQALRVPTFFINGQLSYENKWFKKKLEVQFGIDVHWKSSYFDLGYDPAIQQFYVQDETVTPSFFLTDIFFNGRVGRGRFFFRYHNLIQAFTGSGYMSTPNYPAQRNILDFGFEFMLFD